MTDSTSRSRAATFITAILCGVGIWLIFERSSRKVDAELDKVMNLLETVETNLDESIAKLRKESPEKDEANAALIREREDEIIRLRMELSKLHKQTNDHEGKLLLLKKGKTSAVTALEDNLSWIEEKHKQEIDEIRKDKDKKIRKLEEENRRMKQTKAIAIPALIDALDHPNAEVRASARQALTALAGASLGSNKENWLNWWRRNRSRFIRGR